MEKVAVRDGCLIDSSRAWEFQSAKFSDEVLDMANLCGKIAQSLLFVPRQFWLCKIGRAHD